MTDAFDCTCSLYQNRKQNKNKSKTNKVEQKFILTFTIVDVKILVVIVDEKDDQ